MINPFPGEAVRRFLAGTTERNRYLFALVNAQRAVVMADDAVGGLVEVDRGIVDAALDSCWAAAKVVPDDRLRQHVDPLYGRMLPDWDEAYSPYHSAVNDALAGLVYAIESSTGPDPTASAYFAASSMVDLADHLLHRNRVDYVDDLAAVPIMAFEAQCVTADLERRQRDVADPSDLRRRAIDEGHHIASLAP